MTTSLIRPRPRGALLSAAASIALTVAVGGVGAVATASSVKTWYAGLVKPPFNPPDAVFGPVWTALYVLMALAAWRVWRAGPANGRRRFALILYGVQLLLNLAWSLIFFGLRRPDLALADIIILFFALIATAGAFWRTDRIAALMMVPYAVWVIFAAVLNFEIWRLN